MSLNDGLFHKRMDDIRTYIRKKSQQDKTLIFPSFCFETSTINLYITARLHSLSIVLCLNLIIMIKRQSMFYHCYNFMTLLYKYILNLFVQ